MVAVSCVPIVSPELGFVKSTEKVSAGSLRLSSRAIKVTELLVVPAGKVSVTMTAL